METGTSPVGTSLSVRPSVSAASNQLCPQLGLASNQRDSRPPSGRAVVILDVKKEERERAERQAVIIRVWGAWPPATRLHTHTHPHLMLSVQSLEEQPVIDHQEIVS